MKKIQYKIILCLLGFLVFPVAGYQIAHAEKDHKDETQKQENQQGHNDFISKFPMLSALLVQDQVGNGGQGGDQITPEPVSSPTPEPTKIATVTSDAQEPAQAPQPVQKQDTPKTTAAPPVLTKAISISQIPKLFVSRTASNALYEQNKLNPTATKLFIIFSSMLAIGGLVMVTGQPQTIAYRMSSFFSFL